MLKTMQIGCEGWAVEPDGQHLVPLVCAGTAALKNEKPKKNGVWF